MATIGGCKYSGPPQPYSVGTSRIGTLLDNDIDPQFVRIALGANVSSSAQVKNLRILVEMPDGVELESYNLTTRISGKYTYSKQIKPDSPNSLTWHGEMHPKHSWYENMIKKFERDFVGLGPTIKIPKAALYFKGNIRIHVSFDYYDDPTADPEYEPRSGSHDEVIEISADDLTSEYHPKKTMNYRKR